MARRTLAAKSRARKHQLTARQAETLQAIRSGEVRAVLSHHFEFWQGRRKLTTTVFQLAERGLVKFAHDEGGGLIFWSTGD